MKIIYTLILVCIPIFAQTAKQKTVDIYYDNKYIQSYTLEQFKELVLNAEFSVMLTEAEESNKIKVVLSDKEYTFADGVYQGFLLFIWESDTGIIKQLKVKATLNLSDPSQPIFDKIREKYRTVAEIVLPIAILIILFLL